VKSHANAGMALQALDKRQIGFLVDALQHILKITDRLVGMNQKN